MSIQETNTVSREQEPATSYEVYREFCDEASGNFRLTGIISPEAYRFAVLDTRTVMGEIGGRFLPMITPMEYVEGYDIERTKKLVGKNEVFNLVVPPSYLSELVEGELSRHLGPDQAILIESDIDNYDADKSQTPALLGGVAVEILDDRLPSPEDQPAAMGLFSFRAVPSQESDDEPSTDFSSAFKNLAGESRTITGREGSEVAFYNGHELVENEKVINQIWAICEDRFGDMGEMHPVTMEESRSFFVEMLAGPSVGAVVSFDQAGKVVSFGFLMQDFAECTWMTQQTRDQLSEVAAQNGENHMYFAEIMSVRDRSAKYAADVIGLYCKLVASVQKPYRVIFESSNMSATYIPKIVEEYINSTGTVNVEGSVDLMDKLYYWAIVKQAEAR